MKMTLMAFQKSCGQCRTCFSIEKIRNVDVSPLTRLCKRGGYNAEYPFSEAMPLINFLLFQRRIKASFWAALIFASLYQDKEDRKEVNANEGEAYTDSVLELLEIYSNDALEFHCEA
jgi:hypothetical protein